MYTSRDYLATNADDQEGYDDDYYYDYYYGKGAPGAVPAAAAAGRSSGTQSGVAYRKTGKARSRYERAWESGAGEWAEIDLESSGGGAEYERRSDAERSYDRRSGGRRTTAMQEQRSVAVGGPGRGYAIGQGPQRGGVVAVGQSGEQRQKVATTERRQTRRKKYGLPPELEQAVEMWKTGDEHLSDRYEDTEF